MFRAVTIRATTEKLAPPVFTGTDSRSSSSQLTSRNHFPGHKTAELQGLAAGIYRINRREEG